MKKIMMILLGVALFVSCNPSRKAYNDLESFTEYLENNSASFSDEEWDGAIEEYSSIAENVDAQAYTDEERVAIGKLKGRCAAQFAKHTIGSATKELNDFLLEAGGFINSFVNEFSEEKSKTGE